MIEGANAVGSLAATLLNGVITPVFGWRPIGPLAAACGVVILIFTRSLARKSPVFAAHNKRKGAKAGSLKLILADRRCRINLLKWMCCSMFLMAGFYGTNTWLPTYMTSEFGSEFRSMTYFIAGKNCAMVFIGKMLAGVLSDKIGRRKVMVFGLHLYGLSYCPL